MTTLQGWFKNAYADKIDDLTPENVYYAKEIKALSSEMQPGGYYTVPVTLTSEQGVTLAGSNSGLFSLSAPIAMATQQAQLAGAQCLIRSGLDYETIFRSKNQNAFIKATKGIVQNMVKSAYFYMEAGMMWGQASKGIGTITSTGTNSFVVTTSEFAPGLWLGSEGRKIRIEAVTTGVLVGTCTITGWDLATRTITVDSLPAGAAATNVIRFETAGALGANEMIGIQKVIETTSGNLFGISTTTYNMWSTAGTYAAGSAPLTFNKLMYAIAQGVNKGLGDDYREIECVLNPNTWISVGNEMAGLKRNDVSYKTSTISNGSEAIEFYCQAGAVKLVSHKLMKEGYAFIHPSCSKSMTAVGSNPKPTFELPGLVGSEGQYLRTLENSAGVETRIYWNNALYPNSKQHQWVGISGIVNPSL
jgi:hypothetical protein